MVRLLSRRVIHNLEGSPYLIRWTLISTPWFRIFLHKILRSDDDRDLHDHPWPFATLLLWGRYTEHVPVHTPPEWKERRFKPCKMITKSRMFGPGSLIFHKAEDCHRLDLELSAITTDRGPPIDGYWQFKPVWTLFIAGPRQREWGFHTPTGWVPWEEYCHHDPSDIEDC